MAVYKTKMFEQVLHSAMETDLRELCKTNAKQKHTKEKLILTGTWFSVEIYIVLRFYLPMWKSVLYT